MILRKMALICAVFFLLFPHILEPGFSGAQEHTLKPAALNILFSSNVESELESCG